MFKYIENFLTEPELEQLREISLIETSGDNVCPYVPLYQSADDMHVKYPELASILHKVERTIVEIINMPVEINAAWFNRTTEESDYGWHDHGEFKPPVAVLYIFGCENQGTIFRIGEADLVINNVKDNSLVMFHSSLQHQTPNWNGNERMTMAITLNEKR